MGKMKKASGAVDLKVEVEYDIYEAPVGVTCKYKALNDTSGPTQKPNDKTTAKPNTVKPNDQTTAKPNTVKPNEKTTAKPNTIKPNDKTTAKPNANTTAKPKQQDSPQSVTKLGDAVLQETDAIKNISDKGMKNVTSFSTTITTLRSSGEKPVELRTLLTLNNGAFGNVGGIKKIYGPMYMSGFYLTSTVTIYISGTLTAGFNVGGIPGFLGFANGGFVFEAYYYFVYRYYRW